MNMIFFNDAIRGTRMIRKAFVALLVAGVAASASVVADSTTIAQKVDSINAKRGLTISGGIRAIYQGSYFSSDQDLDGTNDQGDVERNEFVDADIDFHFRPWEQVRVNAMLRLEAGMQNYFASSSKSISLPWLNVEGNIGENFYWIVGNFRQQYTPLTLFAPGIDIMNEPQIFARERSMSQKQALLQGNGRNLQGVNLQFRNYFNNSVGELRVEGILARLRRVQALDFSGENGNILPNEGISGASEAANMDKWLLSGNIELLPLERNVLAGVTGMYIFDDQSSFGYTYRHVDSEDLNSAYVLQPINPYDLDPQSTLVESFRVGSDVAGILKNKSLILDVTAECALSQDDIYNTTTLTDSIGNTTLDSMYVVETLNGSALLVTLNAGYKTDKWNVRLLGNFVRNDEDWFNNLAQSPQFFARRILNSDKDGNTIKYGVNSPLYSTFDALYHFDPKYTPASSSLGTDDPSLQQGQTDSYNIAPFNKNSWTSTVLTRSELDLVNQLSDPSVQLVLPNGFATSNRTGVSTNLTAGIGDGLAEVQGLFNMYTQTKAESGADKAEFLEYGGGAKIDIFKLLGFTLPLELSGSYKHSNRTQKFDDVGSAELNSDFINVGLYVRYLPRLGFSAGFQMINTELNTLAAEKKAASDAAIYTDYVAAPLVKGEQMQWMVGLDYTIVKDVWLALNYGMIFVDNTYTSSTALESGSTNMPDYAVIEEGQTSYRHTYSFSVIEASINVDF